MRVLADRHLLEDAPYIESPNQNERPAGTDIDLIVIHGISLPRGQYGGRDIEALFTNRLDAARHPDYRELEGLRVSAHLVIYRGGEVTQFVPFNKRAWHAGESGYRGRCGCNDFSIGIELEGCDDDSYEDLQYRTLADVTRALLAAYPSLSPRRIACHSDIAPERKTDPGPHFQRDFLERW